MNSIGDSSAVPTENFDPTIHFFPEGELVFKCNINSQHSTKMRRIVSLGIISQMEIICEDCKYTRNILVEHHETYMAVRYGILKNERGRYLFMLE